MFCWAHKTIPPPSISGLLGVSLRKWPAFGPFSQAKMSKNNSTESSKFSEHLTPRQCQDSKNFLSGTNSNFKNGNPTLSKPSWRNWVMMESNSWKYLCPHTQKMLRLNPEERISASEALKHKYFDDLPQSMLPNYKWYLIFNLYHQIYLPPSFIIPLYYLHPPIHDRIPPPAPISHSPHQPSYPLKKEPFFPIW